MWRSGRRSWWIPTECKKPLQMLPRKGRLIELMVKQPKFWKKITTLGVHEIFDKLVVGHVGQDYFWKHAYCAIWRLCFRTLHLSQRYKTKYELFWVTANIGKLNPTSSSIEEGEFGISPGIAHGAHQKRMFFICFKAPTKPSQLGRDAGNLWNSTSRSGPLSRRTILISLMQKGHIMRCKLAKSAVTLPTIHGEPFFIAKKWSLLDTGKILHCSWAATYVLILLGNSQIQLCSFFIILHRASQSNLIMPFYILITNTILAFLQPCTDWFQSCDYFPFNHLLMDIWGRSFMLLLLLEEYIGKKWSYLNLDSWKFWY